MAVKIYKPVTPGLRGMTGYTFEEITKKTPERSLLVLRKAKAGRNAYGRVTVRHQGGGNRQYIRLVDFKREKRNIPARVVAIEYDPIRTARLALLSYADGEKRYILAPLGLKVGDSVVAGASVDIRPGNSMPISNIPPAGDAGRCGISWTGSSAGTPPWRPSSGASPRSSRPITPLFC